MLRRSLSGLVLSCTLVSTSCVPDSETPNPNGPAAPTLETTLYTPAWAFEPWISKDISTGADMDAFIDGFRQRDIPVGVAVLDSPWETHYNTFIPNADRYPGFFDMVERWRGDGIRTVLWVTQMVNDQGFDVEPGGDTYVGPASNFIEGLENDYYVNGGKSYFWWKGTGAGVDFFNVDAVKWWRAQQDELLARGIAGWKLDFGEQYITDVPIETADGDKTLQEYSERYYQDFLAHGQHQNGAQEFLTMVRPYDESYSFAPRFYARPEHAPVAWPGDQDRDWSGLVDGLDHIFRSAQVGYTVLGTDIGGYLDNNNAVTIPFDLEVFQRWTAVATWHPFFQLHGRANLAPWTVEGTPQQVDETVAAYRYGATLHHAMVPYWFSLTREAQPDGAPILHPIGDDVTAWTDDWRFRVGDQFLIAPLIAPGGAREVALPDGVWFDWWDLAGAEIVGGSTVAFTAADARQVGVYVRQGAIVPLALDRDDIIEGGGNNPDALTVLLWPAATETAFVLHDWQGDDDGSTARITLIDGSASLDGVTGPVELRLRSDQDVAVTHNGAPATTRFDAATRALWVTFDATGDDALSW